MVNLDTEEQLRNGIDRIATAYLFSVTVGMRKSDLLLHSANFIARNAEPVHFGNRIAVYLHTLAGVLCVIEREQEQEIGAFIVIISVAFRALLSFIETDYQNHLDIIAETVFLAVMDDNIVSVIGIVELETAVLVSPKSECEQNGRQTKHHNQNYCRVAKIFSFCSTIHFTHCANLLY
jgi:hypothetical protein